MDPITQGAVGAAAAQLGSARSRYVQAAIIGALGGMAPDLDVLIRSGSDPLLALDFHRQFTHSLFAIPALGALCGALLYWLLGKRWQLTLRQTMLWSILGYATHGLLDGCTSYGTQLLWPFSNRRYAWDTISVVDPLFSVPLMAALAIAAAKQSRTWLLVGTTWAALYLAAGYVQHQRALELGYQIAASRGHTPSRLEAKPSFANIAVWKVLYETADHFHVDAVKPGLSGNVIWRGETVAKFNAGRDLGWLGEDTQQYRDILRFEHFSDGYIAIDHRNPLRVVDIRYSMLPQQINALWGIELSRDRPNDAHVKFFTRRDDSSGALKTLIAMIFE